MPKTTESLAEFYKQKFNGIEERPVMKVGHFDVFRIEDWIHAGSVTPTYIRRDFYKIMLFEGDNVFHYGDKSIEVSGKTLLFFNPRVPYTSDPLRPQTKGYFCVFKDDLFQDSLRLGLYHLPVFSAGAQPVFSLNDEIYLIVKTAFEKMISEINSEYIYKHELIKNYVSELIYTAMKLQPLDKLFQHPDASSRIAAVFTELLERQFPIINTTHRFELRSPNVIAERLSVHVNYLNRAIKKTTGRTTTDLIAERLITEAKALLRHTNWNIAEISHVLGFEDQAQFNNFFKKNTGLNPSSFRQV
ncbi:helix-turn-helix transcriptional regulator [Mucilaginibacter sp. UR6-1]|uniref:helix-turn-helix domain-containing protein n=1 Tax=Mucilaginibacter sp. UR6-1 TaxID=1435643 RepID=UPI001E4B533C|nr:AraC family transcriptional regulator [Mucilaginibacter sp. UR6-1]MCC8409151.1 helix-turn-helix transcriptional regulator [Mucilaginibacter sp. UR6-1]